MSPYVLAPLAREDLREIWDRIAEDDFDTADRVVDEIRSAILHLTRHPLMGHVRRDLAPPAYRFWPVYSYSSSTAPTPHLFRSFASGTVLNVTQGSFEFDTYFVPALVPGERSVIGSEGPASTKTPQDNEIQLRDGTTR